MRFPAFACFLASTCFLTGAAAAPSSPSKSGRGAHAVSAPLPAPPATLSVGSPTDGHLENAVAVEPSSSLRIVPIYAPRDVRWGLPDLVKTLTNTSSAVAKRFSGAVMSVGDLSRRHGGEVDRHVSHESGRDADVGFYVVDEKGKQVLSSELVAFDQHGRGKAFPHLRFDDARNWQMISGLLSGPSQVQYLFIASYLRARLLTEATRVHAAPALRTRAAELMVEPRGVLPHDDHVHVRIHCPSRMKSCVDWPTPKASVMARRRGLLKPSPPRVSTPIVIAVPIQMPETETPAGEPAMSSVDDADGELSTRGRAGR